MADVDSTAVSGVEVRGYRRGTLSTDSWDQYVIPVEDKINSFRGRVTTFITLGRAAVGQKVFAIHNATASAVLVDVNRIYVDVVIGAVKAVTVIPPLIRVHRFTAIPTNGTTLSKVSLDTALSSNASVTVWGDASADGTNSATTLTVTIPAASCLRQTAAGRVFTAVGYEPMDPAGFFVGEPDVVLRPLEGLCVFLDQATVTTGNPATDRWNVTCDWTEYTRP